MNPQEVWLAEFPYEDVDEVKKRPVIILDVDDEEALVLSIMVTTHKPRDEYDIEIFDWSKIPLSHPSTARVSKAITIPKEDFYCKIGKLSDEDWSSVVFLYTQYLNNNGY